METQRTLSWADSESPTDKHFSPLATNRSSLLDDADRALNGVAGASPGKHSVGAAQQMSGVTKLN